jgi:hypothetical protein
MSLPSNLEPWTFDGVSFYRIVSGEFPRWFAQAVAYQTDSVLDGSVRYLDLGGRTLEPLSIRAATPVEADREALLARRGSEGTLTSAHAAYTTSAMLIKATPIFIVAGLYVADLEFEVTY